MALPTQCPLCSSKLEDQLVLTPHVYGDVQGGYAFFECKSCGVIYLYPQLTVEQEHQFYVNEFEGFMSGRAAEKAGWEAPERHRNANQSQFQRRWEYLKKYLPERGKILEFGCSSGFMLFPLKEKGYDCYGIEPSGCFSEYVRSKGIEVFENYGAVKEKFDVVMHYFVLEHVRDPLDFINSNLNLLKSGGKLIVEIPNAADPLHTIYNIPEFEKFYWSIAHHWYFNEGSLHFLLSKIPGITYELQRDQRYDLSNHMIWARDGKPGGMGRFSSHFQGRLDKVYKETMINSGHCDTLILIIKKDEL